MGRRATTFGTTAWGRWFAESLEAFDENGRLSRGKSYANTGKVFELEAEGRTVRAKVEGRSSPWYRVSIAFPPLPKAEEAELLGIVEADPMILARIEAGESPPELVDGLRRKGIELIPKDWNSMKRSCSCPDWGDPCKHMAAVYYLLAREIDRDPRLLFRLRGVSLPSGCAAKGERRKPGNGGGSLSGPKRTRSERAAKPATAAPFPDCGPGPFALPGAEPEPARLENYAGFIIALLPPSDSFCSEDFRIALAGFYHAAAAACAKEEEAAPAGDGSTERKFADARYAIYIPGALAEGGVSAAAAPAPEITVIRSGAGEKEERLGLLEASRLFLGFSSPEGCPEYRFLFHLFRLVKAIRSSSAFVPFPVVDDGRLRMGWRPLPQARDVQAALAGIAHWDPGILRVKGKPEARGRGGPCVGYLAARFLAEWTRSLDYRPAGMKAATRELSGLFFGAAAVDARRPGETGLPGALEAWLSVYAIDFGARRYRLSIAAADREASSFELRLALMAGDGAEGQKALPLRKAVDAAGAAARAEVLAGPAALSAYLPEIRELAVRDKVAVAEERLGVFLGEAPGLLSKLGVEVVLPKSLRKALTPELRLEVEAKPGKARALVSYLDMDSALSYDWKIALGDTTIGIEEFERLVRSKRPVILFREGFVRIDPAEAARLIERAKALRRESKARYAEQRGSGDDALGVIRARLSGEAAFSADAEEVVAGLFRERELALPRGLRAALRPYQERGYRWMASNLLSGFGCLLADDMGLGKTVQAIALMARLEEDGLLPGGVLVVAPAALLPNWERELAKFAPGLGAGIYHGPRRSVDDGALVHLTTYQTVARDGKKLAEAGFSLLVVDEAQVLKNEATQAARAVKGIGAAYRVALSGTPVENRLEDLRSIFDLVLPGYLGGASEFKKAWRVPIEVDRDAAKAGELKRITSPFLLRRLKTDRAIISDLPDKVEADEYARLAPVQAALYAGIVDEGMARLGEAEGAIERQGALLSLFTSLKQVCDHPRVYDKESPADPGLSGKCGLLLALLEETLDRREKVIVFSQYVETLVLLKEIVAASLGEDALLYHGGMGAKRRDEAVQAFQNNAAQRVMLVSLKAGGLGLNLTAASRVIHYDLWFNPAVENQATDRAYRIGQAKNVFVHRFITLGTFEEKLDAMIKAKRELAEMSVASGESWLSRMSDEEIRGLFS
jgi:superfamily II DNA or RNA helicase